MNLFPESRGNAWMFYQIPMQRSCSASLTSNDNKIWQ
jgi:hypothetical protein